jgi:hypothetical protein
MLLGHVWRGQEAAVTYVARPRGCGDTCGEAKRLPGHMWLDPGPGKHETGHPRLLRLNELGKSVAEPQSSATHSRTPEPGLRGFGHFAVRPREP